MAWCDDKADKLRAEVDGARVFLCEDLPDTGARPTPTTGILSGHVSILASGEYPVHR
ncbi:hypothetical protein HerbRD11066_74600 [Herbidospora sp. RD11066]